MEYRKLIAFGKNSYVVSIPKAWIKQHKLVKGDVLHLQEGTNQIILKPGIEKSEEEKTVKISVDGKSISQIERELVPSYVNNHKTIILSGNEIKSKASEIAPLIQNLIALEIMEQDSSKIVAKDFLNMKEISIKDLVRKMDMIVQAMVQDTITMFEEDSYENINHRDKDVNRLSYLAFRAIHHGLENPSGMHKNHGLSPIDLFRYHILVSHIELIGDEARRIARYMGRIKLPKKKQQEFISLLKRGQDVYCTNIKSFFSNEPELAHKVAANKKDLLQDCEKFYLDNREIQWIAYLVDRLKRFIGSSHKMGRVTYQ